jgi:hypothetical protein
VFTAYSPRIGGCICIESLITTNFSLVIYGERVFETKTESLHHRLLISRYRTEGTDKAGEQDYFDT